MNLLRFYYGVKQKTLECFLKIKRNDLSVFVFHEVIKKENAIDKELSTDPTLFENFLLKNKPIICSLNDLNEMKNVGKFVITFDDVFESVFANAFPLLNKHEIPFTVFVCKDLIGKPGYITEEQLEKFKECKFCEIGFHFNKHVFSRTLKKSDFLDQASPKSFCEKYGVKCKYLAYPYGSFYATKKHFAKKEILNMFSQSFSTIKGHMSYSMFLKRRYFLPRITLNESSIQKYL